MIQPAAGAGTGPRRTLARNICEEVGVALRIIIGIAVLAVAGVIMAVRHQTAKLGEQAEAAYPGPLE